MKKLIVIVINYIFIFESAEETVEPMLPRTGNILDIMAGEESVFNRVEG